MNFSAILILLYHKDFPPTMLTLLAIVICTHQKGDKYMVCEAKSQVRFSSENKL